MRDQHFDRDYQQGREALNDGIDKLLRSIPAGFRTLQAIQFSAPWKKEHKAFNPRDCGHIA